MEQSSRKASATRSISFHPRSRNVIGGRLSIETKFYRNGRERAWRPNGRFPSQELTAREDRHGQAGEHPGREICREISGLCARGASFAQIERQGHARVRSSAVHG